MKLRRPKILTLGSYLFSRPALLGLALLGSVTPNWAQPVAPAPLQLLYQAQAPFISADDDGQVKGLVADPVNQAMALAGVAVRWVSMPQARQLSVLHAGKSPYCAVGCTRKTGQPQDKSVLAWAPFSRVVYQDRPLVALSHAGSRLVDDTLLRQLLNDPALTLMLREEGRYGQMVETVIDVHAVHKTVAPATAAQQVRQLLQRPTHWMLVSPEEASELIRLARTLNGRLRTVQIRDMGSGPERLLLCNRAVPADWLLRLDRALPPQLHAPAG